MDHPFTETQQAQLRSIAERYQLDLVLLFGSRVRGRGRANSDYDIAVLDYNHPLGDEEETRLACELYTFFQTDAVDLVRLRRTSPLLQFTAANEGMVLYEREPGIHRQYRWRACKLWEDNRWRHDRRKRYVEGFLARAGLR
jgi:predicted nucleotidyltransferase